MKNNILSKVNILMISNYLKTQSQIKDMVKYISIKTLRIINMYLQNNLKGNIQMIQKLINLIWNKEYN